MRVFRARPFNSYCKFAPQQLFLSCSRRYYLVTCQTCGGGKRDPDAGRGRDCRASHAASLLAGRTNGDRLIDGMRGSGHGLPMTVQCVAGIHRELHRGTGCVPEIPRGGRGGDVMVTWNACVACQSGPRSASFVSANDQSSFFHVLKPKNKSEINCLQHC